MGSSLAAFVTNPAGITWLMSCAVEAALLLAASWLGAALLRSGPPAARHQIWTLGVIGALLLPLLCWALPSLSPSPATPVLTGTTLVAPAVFVTAAAAAVDTAPAWPLWLSIVWAIGALVVALRLLRDHLAARRLVHAAVPSVPAAWSVAFQEAAASLALARRIPLLRSEGIGSPMTVGVFRPRVLLPAAATAWPPERLRAVLVHELGHVRRHDIVVQVIAQVACALYWWNPLAWLAAARLRLEREHACDDLVLGAGILPSSYAADLLEVARSISMDARVHAGATCMADRSWTDERLRRILDATVQRRPIRTRFRITACALTLAGAATLACTTSPPALSSSPPSSRGTLSLGAPFVRDPYPFGAPVNHGAIDLSLVATELNRRLDELDRCYQRRLAVNAALSGTVVIHWTIDKNGNVPEACITSDTVGDREIIDCVNKLVLEGHFPAPRGGAVDVSFPFVFTSRAAIAAR